MAGRLRDALVAVNERVSGDASERDVATLFAETGVYETLGYEGTGVDLRSEYSLPAGARPDVIALDSAGAVRVVFEFKSPGTDLDDSLAQLTGYESALAADYGVLTDGQELRVYDAENRVARVTTDRVTADEAERLQRLLGKPSYDLRDPEDVERAMGDAAAIGLGEEGRLGREHFFDTFRLAADSSFGRLVRALLRVFRETNEEAVAESFGYWSETHGGVPEEPPDSWSALLADAEPDAFVFCLETAHALVSRLLLAKAIGDHDVFDTDASDWMRAQVDEIPGPARTIRIERYPWIAERFVETMRRQLVAGAFRDDIFGWWTEAVPRAEETEPYERGDPRHGTWGDTPAEEFGRAVGRVLLDVLRFDFSSVTGDLLGSLYQRYFDPETRKALGEFYTPTALAETMLADLDYRESATTDRLIDPACGSGAFLVAAVRRYIEAVEDASDEPAWDERLHQLCTKPLIVGFDVHPFAVLMAQIRFVAAILPKYGEAKEANPEFVLDRLPVYRTDSLRKETARGGLDDQPSLGSFEEGDRDVFVPVAVPGAEETGTAERTVEGHPVVTVRMPRYRTVRDRTAIDGWGEYFAAMQGVMDSVRSHVERGKTGYDGDVADRIADYTAGTYPGVESFFAAYVERLIGAVSDLPDRDHGRRVDAFEDTTLAVILKNYVPYDFVVGNPPYVRTQTLSAARKRQLEAHYETTTGAYDLYCPFYERGVEWLREGGRLAYVSPNGFFVTEYGRGLRELLSRTRIDRVYDFRDSGVFADATNYPAVVELTVGSEPDDDVRCVRVKQSAADAAATVEVESTTHPESTADGESTADSSTALTELAGSVESAGEGVDPRAEPTVGATDRVERLTDGTGVATAGEELDARVMQAIRTHGDADGEYRGELVDAFDVPQRRLGAEPWGLMPDDEWRVFRRLEEAGNARLSDVTDAVFQGLRTGANGVYVVRVVDADRVAADDTGGVVTVEPTGGDETYRVETDLLRPFLAGRDVSRWRGDWSGLHVLFPYRVASDDSGGDSRERTGTAGDADSEDTGGDTGVADRGWERLAGSEPTVRPVTEAELRSLDGTWAYLQAHEETLRSREGGRFADEDQWWVYARTQNLARMAEPKIVGAEIADRATFAADEDGDWAFTTAYGVRVADRYADRTVPITAQLDSRPLDFYLRHVAPIKNDGYYSYRARFLERLPVVTDGSFEPVRETVAAILAAHDARSRVERFPAPYLEDESVTRIGHEWQTTRRPVEPEVRVESVEGGVRYVVAAGRTDRVRDPTLGPVAADESADGRVTVDLSPDGSVSVEGRSNPTAEEETAALRAEYVRRAVAGRSVRSGETTTVRLPRSDETVGEVLSAVAADERRWAETDVAALESRIDRLVADAFGLSEADRRVVERFCETF